LREIYNSKLFKMPIKKNIFWEYIIKSYALMKRAFSSSILSIILCHLNPNVISSKLILTDGFSGTSQSTLFDFYRRIPE